MDEVWDLFFGSSFFMVSWDIASSFFMASWDIASSFFMVSWDIASSFFMVSLDILSCANATGANAAPSEMMTAEARSKAREELFMIPYPFNTGSERRQSSNSIRYGWARGYSARKIVKRLLRYGKACAAKMTSLLMASTSTLMHVRQSGLPASAAW